MYIPEVPTSNPLQERILSLIGEVSEERVRQPAVLLGLVSDAVRLEKEVSSVAAGVVAAARVAGYTWAEIAFEAGLRSAQAAYYRWGADADLIQAAQELNPQPAVKAKAATVPAPELPGVSLAEAARTLGLNPRTVKRRGEQGALRTVEAKQRSGRILTRYLLDEGDRH